MTIKWWSSEALARGLPRPGSNALAAAASGAATWLGLVLLHGSQILLWPGTGVALALMARWGFGLWPGIVAGSFAVTWLKLGSVPLALGYSIGTTVGAWVAAWALRRLDFQADLQHRRDVLLFMVMALLSCAVAVLVTIAPLVLFNGGTVWLPRMLGWWVAGSLGALLAGVPILSLSWRRLRHPLSGWRAVEMAVIFLLLALCGWLSSREALTGAAELPLVALTLLMILALAVRGGIALVSLASAALSLLAVLRMLEGEAALSPEALTLLWSYVASLSGVGLMVTALVSELSITRQHFRATFENAPVGIAHIYVKDGRFLGNQRVADMFGYTLEEIHRLRFDQLAFPDEVEDEADSQRRLLSGEIDGITRETRRRCKNGSVIWIHRTLSLIRDADGTPAYFQAVQVDITERKQAEELRQAQYRIESTVRRMQTLFIRQADAPQTFEVLLAEVQACCDSAYGFIAETFQDTGDQARLKVMALANSAGDDTVCELGSASAAIGLELPAGEGLPGRALSGGQPLSATPGEDLARGLPPGHPPLRSLLAMPMRAGGRIVGLVVLGNRAGGYDAALLRTLEPVFATMASIIAAVRAERERRKAVAALRENDELLSKLTHQVPGIIFQAQVDAERSLSFSYLSDATEALLGRSAAQLRRDPDWWLRSIHPDDETRVRLAVRAATQNQEHLSLVYRAELPGLGLRWFQLHAAPESGAEVTTWHGYLFDVTTREKAQLALTQELQRTRALMESSIDGVHIIDVHGPDSGQQSIVDVNARFAEMLGYEREEVIGMTVPQWAPFAPLNVRDVINEALKTSRGIVFEDIHRRKDGSLFPVEVSLGVLQTPQGTQWLCLSRDISARRQGEERLRLLANVFAHAHAAVMITDANSQIVEVNEAFTALTGYSREEALGRRPSMLYSDRHGSDFYDDLSGGVMHEGLWHGEMWGRHKSGQAFACLLTVSAVNVPNGKPTHYVAQFSDITQLKQQQSRLEQLAHFDPLTQLPNRTLLAERLQRAMTQARRRRGLLATCYLDLDGFKEVNDRLGHTVGDQLLVAVAERLKRHLRGNDTVARLGGDEFVVLLNELSDTAEVEQALQRLLCAIAEPYLLTGSNERVSISSSIGVALFPNDDVDADNLLRHADQAMYQAKQAGRNRYHLFDAEMDRRTRRDHEMRLRVEQALVAGEFQLHYQPQVELGTGRVVGVEALLRWQRGDGQWIAPNEFLPMIESTPLADTLGDWVLRRALAQTGEWAGRGLRLKVSVNLSSRQLQQEDFAHHIGELLAQHTSVEPWQLELEVLETAALDDLFRVSRIMEDCRSMGVSFAIDDFGTGYSSLSYLKRLPADTLKIDQTFVRDMLRDPDDLAIVQGVIGLAKAFRRCSVAEGVETIEHGRVLLQMGCDRGQGHGIAAAMPPAALPGWIVGWQSQPLRFTTPAHTQQAAGHLS